MNIRREISVSDKILLIGQAHYIRQVGLPLIDSLEELAKDFPTSPEEDSWSPETPQATYASISAISGIVGVTIFVVTWGAKKALDELYDVFLKERIRKVLGDFFANNTHGKKYGVALLVNNLPARVSIMVAVVGSTAEDIDAGQKQLGSVLAISVEVASKIAQPGEVHLYIIEAGIVNVHPWVYSNLVDASRHLTSMHPITPIKIVRGGS